MAVFWTQEAALWSLFFSAFASATLLPGSSEAVLIAALKSGHAPLLLWWVASAGNTLGGMTSWLLGYWIATRHPARILKEPGRRRALRRLRRWGWPMLLLSWVPLIGDPLCVAAGWLRMHPLISVLAIGVGKGARYAVLVAVLA